MSHASKHEMIDAIRQHNRTATVPFLMAFSDAELATYLRRLSLADQRGTSWVREGAEPAVTVRDCMSRRATVAA